MAPGSIPRKLGEIALAVNMGKVFDKDFTFWTGFLSATCISSPETHHVKVPTRGDQQEPKNIDLHTSVIHPSAPVEWKASVAGAPPRSLSSRTLSWHDSIYSLLIRWQEAALALGSTRVATQPQPCATAAVISLL